MSDTHKTSTRFYEIDLLRFFSAVMVVLFHYIYVSKRDDMTPPLEFHRYIDWGHYLYVGINFFFIISGFVILMSARDRQPGAFFISRVVRLMPAYWFCVVATSIAIIAFNQPGITVALDQFFANLTMAHIGLGYDHIDTAYWTLWLELKFYAVIWLLCLLGWLKHIAHLLLVTLIASIAALSTSYAEQFDRFGNMFIYAFPHWWGYFACGCTFYLIHRDGFLPYYRLLLGLSLIFVLLQAAVFGKIMAGWFSEPFNPWVLAGSNLLFFAFFCVIVFAKNNPLRRKSFLYLGVLTYPLYLLHQYIGYLWLTYMSDKVDHELLLWGTLAGMLLMAVFVYRFIEKPLAPHLKRWLKKRVRSPGGQGAG